MQLKHFKNYRGQILGMWKNEQSLNLVTNLYVLVEASHYMERQRNIAYLTKSCPKQFNNLNQFRLYIMVSNFGSYGLRSKF